MKRPAVQGEAAQQVPVATGRGSASVRAVASAAAGSANPKGKKRRKKKDKNDAGAADDEAKKKARREKKRQADRLRRQNPVFQVEAARRKRKAREAAG